MYLTRVKIVAVLSVASTSLNISAFIPRACGRHGLCTASSLRIAPERREALTVITGTYCVARKRLWANCGTVCIHGGENEAEVVLGSARTTAVARALDA